MSYIEREALLEKVKSIEERCSKGGGYLPNGGLLECKMEIVFAPSVDVVEVVRCKDCAHYHGMKGFDYKGRKAHHCVWHSALRGENDYCSDGIRREK